LCNMTAASMTTTTTTTDTTTPTTTTTASSPLKVPPWPVKLIEPFNITARTAIDYKAHLGNQIMPATISRAAKGNKNNKRND
jgi:hypothetical protein